MRKFGRGWRHGHHHHHHRRRRAQSQRNACIVVSISSPRSEDACTTNPTQIMTAAPHCRVECCCEHRRRRCRGQSPNYIHIILSFRSSPPLPPSRDIWSTKKFPEVGPCKHRNAKIIRSSEDRPDFASKRYAAETGFGADWCPLGCSRI